MGTTTSRQRLSWTLRAITLLLLLALGTRVYLLRSRSVGIRVAFPNATCSAEVLERPLIFRLLPNGEVALGADIMSNREAMARLPGIRAATYKRTLLFYADASLEWKNVVNVLSDVSVQLPRWQILLVTPSTTKPCQDWLDAHSGPAA